MLRPCCGGLTVCADRRTGAPRCPSPRAVSGPGAGLFPGAAKAAAAAQCARTRTARRAAWPAAPRADVRRQTGAASASAPGGLRAVQRGVAVAVVAARVAAAVAGQRVRRRGRQLAGVAHGLVAGRGARACQRRAVLLADGGAPGAARQRARRAQAGRLRDARTAWSARVVALPRSRLYGVTPLRRCLSRGKRSDRATAACAQAVYSTQHVAASPLSECPAGHQQSARPVSVHAEAGAHILCAVTARADASAAFGTACPAGSRRTLQGLCDLRPRAAPRLCCARLRRGVQRAADARLGGDRDGLGLQPGQRLLRAQRGVRLRAPPPLTLQRLSDTGTRLWGLLSRVLGALQTPASEHFFCATGRPVPREAGRRCRLAAGAGGYDRKMRRRGRPPRLRDDPPPARRGSRARRGPDHPLPPERAAPAAGRPTLLLHR